MNRQLLDEQQLDALLADVPELKDRGFTRTVDRKLKELDARRRWVFISLGLCWAALCVLVTPFTTFESVNQLVFNFVNSFPGLVEELRSADTVESLLDSSLILPVASVVLGAYALLSLQIRRI